MNGTTRRRAPDEGAPLAGAYRGHRRGEVSASIRSDSRPIDAVVSLDEALVIMKTPEPGISGRYDESFDVIEQSHFELMLNLQLFPCLVAETETARALLLNEDARQLLHAWPPEATRFVDPNARDAAGGRIEAQEVIRYVLGRGPGPHGVELTWHTTGRERWFRVTSQPLPHSPNRTPLSVLTFVNFTGQKVAERELRQTVEARDEFFSVATHELKDPLFSLQLSMQLLRGAAERSGTIPAHVQQHLEIGDRQIARLGRLIDNMLDVARIVNGRLELDAELLDLCELTHQVVGRFQSLANVAETLVEAQSCEPVLGRFDRMKLEQVIGNLVSNAIKYGNAKPVVVRVRSEGDVAFVEVEDKGVGIAWEDQERIFGQFERASRGHKKASLGLGLYIVRSHVQAHGGSIRLKSEPGRGTTFTVSIPRHSHSDDGSIFPGQGGRQISAG